MKILTLDIERIPGLATVPFWTPYDYKNRRIPPDTVVRAPRTICFAWKWEGDRKIDFVSEWGEGQDGMAQVAFDLYLEADVVVGHNIQDFDTPHLQATCRDSGRGLILPKVQHMDTLKIARKVFNYEYNHLDVLCKRFGLPAKVDKYDPDVAELAIAGDAKAQRRLERYNRGDIKASEALGKHLRPYSGINFAAIEAKGGRACTACGSTALQRRGTAVTKAGYRYPRFHCQACGAWSQGRKNDGSEMNEVKPA